MPGIGDIFLNGIKNISSEQAQKPAEDGSAKLAAMKNGDTFQAKVISSSGSDVMLRLPGGETVNARLSSNMTLTEGQTVSFEVKNSGSSVSISPLLTNTSADVSVLKALDFAQIPVTNESTAMTVEMMKAGLPIDRNSLLSMYENVRNNPGADIGNIIDLTKLGIEVNETNLQNIESYKNLSYQIDRGMQTLNELTDKALLDMVKGGNTEGAARVFDTLISSASEYVTADSGFESSEISQELKEIFRELNVPDGTSVLPASTTETVEETVSTENGQKVLPEGTLETVSKQGPDTVVNDNGTSAVSPEKNDAASKALDLLKALQEQGPETSKNTSVENVLNKTVNTDEKAVNTATTEPDVSQPGSASDTTAKSIMPLRDAVSQTIELLGKVNDNPEYKPSDVQTLLNDLTNVLAKASSEGNNTVLKSLISNEAVRSLVFDVLKDGTKVSPSDVADKDKVESLYKRLDDQLTALKNSLASAGQTGTEVFKATENMKSNVDFLQDINQMYAYIQLPLKLSGGEAHGDLYVYSNKKNMTSDDSNVTAFLHLDMENLGPVDVYVAMDIKAGGKVSTNFTVADDETLDLLNEHMDQLTGRLQKRGYDVSCSMKVKSEEQDPEEDALSKGGVNFLLMHSGFSGASYNAGMRSFDVRA